MPRSRSDPADRDAARQPVRSARAEGRRASSGAASSTRRNWAKAPASSPASVRTRAVGGAHRPVHGGDALPLRRTAAQHLGRERWPRSRSAARGRGSAAGCCYLRCGAADSGTRRRTCCLGSRVETTPPATGATRSQASGAERRRAPRGNGGAASAVPPLAYPANWAEGADGISAAARSQRSAVGRCSARAVGEGEGEGGVDVAEVAMDPGRSRTGRSRRGGGPVARPAPRGPRRHRPTHGADSCCSGHGGRRPGAGVPGPGTVSTCWTAPAMRSRRVPVRRPGSLRYREQR